MLHHRSDVTEMKPDWSVQQEIIKRAQKESEYQWSFTENPPLPRYQEVRLKKSAGVWNFIKHNIAEFRP